MGKKSSKNIKRGKPKDNGRRGKKRLSPLVTDQITYVDYKDVNLLRRFVSDRAKIRARRVTGNTAQQQAEVAMAIKNAREMALMPYITKVTTQRGNKGDRGDRGDRGQRSDGPPPKPTSPPPPPGGAPGAEDAAAESDEGLDDGKLPEGVTLDAAPSGEEA